MHASVEYRKKSKVSKVGKNKRQLKPLFLLLVFDDPYARLVIN